MSNKVGELYNTVIESVIRETKTEFEDTGDDPAVLDMLMKAWRKRLGEMNVIKDPGWDSEAKRDERVPGWDPEGRKPDGMTLGQPSLPGSIPGADSSQLNTMPSSSGADNITMANDALLFGPPPIKQEQSDVNIPGSQQVSSQQYSQSPASVTGASQSTASQHPLYVKDQQPFDMLGSTDRPGTGFNPLNSAKPDHESHDIQPSQQPGSVQLPHGASLSPELQRQLQDAMNRHPKVPQTDGPLDEELNSDLDDSEDELIDSNDDEEGEQTQIMLCLYEKVHKVKTRWKYTLKDGVANVNGLDYVFARANGESDW